LRRASSSRQPRLFITTPLPLREKVYGAIRNYILNGDIPPGERLIEAQLAKRIKASRTPVREALHLLEKEGLLEAIPRVGYRVKELKFSEVEEICQIRTVNEILAARWAIHRITHKEIQALEKNIAGTEAELRKGNLLSFVEFDAEFHEILVRASGSERLLELCQLLRRHMLRYRVKAITRADVVERAIDGHQKILERIKEKDLVGLETAIANHLEISKGEIQRYAFEDDSRDEGVVSSP
jgi:DNA-binding GntR family transcriptional regulator